MRKKICLFALIFIFVPMLAMAQRTVPFWQFMEYATANWGALDPNGTLHQIGVDPNGNFIFKTKDGSEYQLNIADPNQAGVVPVTSGGTGLTTLTDHGVVLGSGTGDVSITDSGADGEVLVSNGASTDPDWEYLPRENQLSNTGWVFNSNSDTNKGLATMTFDAGAAGGGDIPDAGDAGTGGTSGATCKIISLTVATGAFATNDATGTITIGASAGRFHDNETVTFTDGETVVVNHPNSAAGVDLVRNGEFSVDTDPTPGWTAGASATLTTEAGGKIGNCMMVTENGEANPTAQQTKTVEANKNYYFVCYIKAGTEATYTVRLYDEDNANYIYSLGNKEETAGDWSTSVTQYFVAPSGCSSVRIMLQQICDAAAGTTMYFDEISLYEVTACNTGADNLTFDGWYKTTGLDVYREFPGSNTKNGTTHSLLAVNGSGSTQYLIWNGNRTTKTDFLRKFYERTLCGAAWVKASAASKVRIVKYEDAYANLSSLNSGTSFEWLEGSFTCGSTAADVRPFVISIADGATAYISQPILSPGSSIGQGNYVPEADRRVYFENEITSQKFNGVTGFSDVSITELNLEADSKCCIGKGVKAVRVYTDMRDSGSAGTDDWFIAGYDISACTYEFINSPYGLANDTYNRAVGFIPCNSSGNYEYQINASGSATFDINTFTYIGGEWR